MVHPGLFVSSYISVELQFTRYAVCLMVAWELLYIMVLNHLECCLFTVDQWKVHREGPGRLVIVIDALHELFWSTTRWRSSPKRTSRRTDLDSQRLEPSCSMLAWLALSHVAVARARRRRIGYNVVGRVGLFRVKKWALTARSFWGIGVNVSCAVLRITGGFCELK